MCDLYIEGKYICNECAEEFTKKIGSKSKKNSEMKKSFLDFISSAKEEEEITNKEDEITVQQFFENQNEKNF
jgi:transposase-like protein